MLKLYFGLIVSVALAASAIFGFQAYLISWQPIPLTAVAILIVGSAVIYLTGELAPNSLREYRGRVRRSEKSGEFWRRIILPLTALGLAFGTSLPEGAGSGVAVWFGQDVVAVTNIVGSGILNPLLIGALAFLVIPRENAVINKKLVLPVLVLALPTGIMLYCMTNGSISSVEAVGLVGLSVLCMICLLFFGGDVESADSEEKPVSNPMIIMIIGFCLIAFAAGWIVDGALGTAELIGMSSGLAGLLIVALGTSLPELVSAVPSAWRGLETATWVLIALIGSNAANMLFLGIIALFSGGLEFAPGAETDISTIFSVVGYGWFLLAIFLGKLPRLVGLLGFVALAAFLYSLAKSQGLL